MPKHPAPDGLTLYYWSCSLILLAPSLLLDRATSPLCATLRIACGKPYLIEVNGQQLETRASLVAPGAKRNRVIALDSQIALFYIPLDAVNLQPIKQLLNGQELLNFSIDRFAHLLPTIELAAQAGLTPSQARQLMNDTLAALIDSPLPPPAPMEARVQQTIELLRELPLTEVETAVLCQATGLSASRLRTLFKQETGFTIQQYARWLAVWRAGLLWRRGVAFTDLAIEVGFHDLSHVDHAFNEFFGVSPTHMVDPNRVRLINCDEAVNT